MKAVAFHWMDDRQLNQVVCHTFREVIDFIKQNQEQAFFVTSWTEMPTEAGDLVVAAYIGDDCIDPDVEIEDLIKYVFEPGASVHIEVGYENEMKSQIGHVVERRIRIRKFVKE